MIRFKRGDRHNLVYRPMFRIPKKIPATRKRNTKKLVLIFIIAVFFIFLFFNPKVKLYFYLYRHKTFCLKNQFDKAKALHQRIFVLYPSDPLIYEAYGFFYISKGDLDKAEYYYKEALNKGITSNRIFNHLSFGSRFFNMGLMREALIEYRQSLKLSPLSPKGHYEIALTYHALGNIQNAIIEYKKALSIDPFNEKYQHQMEKAMREKIKGKRTYFYDRNKKTLAQYQFSDNTSVYLLGYKTAHILGFKNDKFGEAGLENSLKKYLPGCEITLTIDQDLQVIADEVLGKGRKGSIVILNSKTGEILALVNHPNFNPNRMDKDCQQIIKNKYNPLLNRALEGLYEPGSICKLITVAACLDSKKDYKSVFPVKCDGTKIYNNTTFYDWQRHGNVTNINQALDLSCNIAFSRLGLFLGPEMLLSYTKKFGFLSQLDIELPVSSGRLPDSLPTEFDIADFSSGMGESYKITPLLACMLAATIANDGILMKPFFVKEIKTITGRTVKIQKPQIYKEVIFPETAKKIQKMMLETVEEGIGKLAKTEGISIAGKTGTSGNSKKRMLNAWFICFAPYDDPQYAVAIVVEGGTGMHVAAPIIHKLFSRIMELKNPQK